MTPHNTDDAALIAAAPELYECLTDMVNRFHWHLDTGSINARWQSKELIELIYKCKAALAKAEGNQPIQSDVLPQTPSE